MQQPAVCFPPDSLKDLFPWESEQYTQVLIHPLQGCHPTSPLDSCMFFQTVQKNIKKELDYKHTHLLHGQKYSRCNRFASNPELLEFFPFQDRIYQQFF
jgi:hypothetical protein